MTGFFILHLLKNFLIKSVNKYKKYDKMLTEVKNMIGKKIKYYRLKNGMTTEELAKAIGCTKASISLYENEEREPNADICKKLASALGVSWTELLSRNKETLVFDHACFRKKQKATKKDIELLTMNIESMCRDRITLMNIVGLINYKVFKPNKLSFNVSAFENAKIIRKSLGLPANGPIYSVTNVLERAGIIVLSFDCADEIDGINGLVNGIPYIFFNSKDRTIERQRFTIVHEMCHLFFNESHEGMTEKDIEKYINQVAGNVLIPNDDIYAIFGMKNRNITIYLRDQISKDYKIAPSCLLTRLLETGVITDRYYKGYFMILNSKGGRKNEQTLLDAKEDSEQPTIFTQQVYLALSEELISVSRAAEFLHKPLYDVMQKIRIE